MGCEFWMKWIDMQRWLQMEVSNSTEIRWTDMTDSHITSSFLFTVAGCQPKTVKTFVLMVKPLKPLFFSEKPLFSGKAGFFFSIQGAKIL